MAFNKILYLAIFFLCWLTCVQPSAAAGLTTLYQSVEQALDYSPQLQSLNHNYEAIEYDLKRARGRYLPSVDLLLGYGLEQYSDRVTRQPGAHPGDTDWDPRGDASLVLTQKVYDGGETSNIISSQKARKDSAHFLIQDATQAVVLNAIIAHLDVYRERELVALAEKDLKFHQDICQSLSEMEQGGAGNIADVTQTQARMARAESNLSISKANLTAAIANYERVIGAKPGELAYAEVSGIMPKSLEEAVTWAEQRNPQLLALNAKITEADARVDLARSAYKPKINVELSSRYNNRLEGDPSWRFTNDAMVVLRWNLFNGGQDRAEEKAAFSRKQEIRSNWDEKLFELREKTSAAWANYLSLQRQEKAYRDAVAYGERTLDSYMKQFNVSKRSLLDVLDAEKEYFQSASQLVAISVEKIIAAYRILALGGELQISRLTEVGECPAHLSRLAQAMVFLCVAQSTPPGFIAPSSIPTESPVRVSAIPETEADLKHGSGGAESKIAATAVKDTSPRPQYPYSIYLGSYKTPDQVRRAISIYEKKGLSPYWAKVDLEDKGSWFRLFAAYFPCKEAAEGYIKENRIPEAKPGYTKYALYHGKYRSAEELDEKKEELTALGCSPYVIKGPNGEALLYTGAFSRKDLAETELRDFVSTGVVAELVVR